MVPHLSWYRIYHFRCFIINTEPRDHRWTRERRVLNESCTANMLTHLRDSIHSDPESGLHYWVSRVYDDKDLRMTMCDRVLIRPNEEILASSAKSVPAREVNLYPRLDLHLRPTRVPQLNEVSYGAEDEEGWLEDQLRRV